LDLDSGRTGRFTQPDVASSGPSLHPGGREEYTGPPKTPRGRRVSS
jgi:hypothetical protein